MHRSSRLRLVALVGVLVVAGATLAACSGGDDGTDTAAASDRPLVVVTTSILGDVVHQVVGDHVEVQVIMGPGVDPHDYQASARDAEALHDADLIVVNGGHLEGSLLDAVQAAEDDGASVFTALDHADPLPLEEGDEHGGQDPHFWQDPQRMALVVDALAPELARIDAGDDVASRAQAYAAELRALDGTLAQRIAALPTARRVLVTDHDAFGYFADHFGFTIIGVIIPGGGTSGAPSARDLADLADAVSAAGVPAIFSENTVPARTAEALAREVGSDVEVVQLYSDALGPQGSDGSTYTEMLQTNVARIVDTLG